MLNLTGYRHAGLLFENARRLAVQEVPPDQLTAWRDKYQQAQDLVATVQKCPLGTESARPHYLAKTLKTLFELCTSEKELAQVIESLDIQCNGIAKAPIDTSFAA